MPSATKSAVSRAATWGGGQGADLMVFITAYCAVVIAVRLSVDMFDSCAVVSEVTCRCSGPASARC